MSEESDLKGTNVGHEQDAEEIGRSSRGTLLAGLLGALALLIALVTTVVEWAERHHEFLKQDSIICKGVEHPASSFHYKVHYLIEVGGPSVLTGFGGVFIGIIALALLLGALSLAFSPMILNTNPSPSTPRKLM